ncbi:MAG: NAD(P)H-hydrate dehydratase [Candidatus Rariloculaceae bacterium]
MAELPAEIYSAQQVRDLDRVAIEGQGIPAYELMCRAGAAALACIERDWPDVEGLTILCGAGNNAGDGYVLARLAAAAGLRIRVIAISSPENLTGAAANAWSDLQAAGGSIEPFAGGVIFDDDLIVDALLGTGLQRDLGGDYLAVVEAINAAPNPVLALDMPTGLEADSGMPMADAVQADVTISFVGLNSGLFLGLAPDYCGKLEFSDLDIPREVYRGSEYVLERLTSGVLREVLPPRRASSHKRSHGSLLLIGGSNGMAGAILLAGEAALRAGAGLVRVATHASSTAAVVAARPELMTLAVSEPSDLDEAIESADAIVIGPGLGQTAWARGLMERALASDLPVVLDADGLNLLAKQPAARGNWILTPHPGEAARLLQCDVATIQRDRMQAAIDLSDRYAAAVVLKGASSLVAAPGEAPVAVCDRGNPGMATAGMGDVLAGVAGALRVQTGDNRLSMRAAVLLHALAGDAAVTDGQRGLVARDLMPHIRRYANPI